MKLFVILHKGEVVAISEEKKDVVNFMKAKKFGPDHILTKVKGKTAERVILDFEDLYLEHDEKLDMVLTRMELRILDDIIGEEKSRIATTIADLKHYLRNYKMSKKEKSVLKKALKIMESTKKTKRLKKTLKLDEFFGIMGRSKGLIESFRQRISDMADKLFIFVNLKE